MTVREPITVVELWQDFCTLTYGTGACRATKATANKLQRRSIFSTDVAENNSGTTGVYWRHTADAKGQWSGDGRPGDGFNIIANNQGDPAIDWVLPNNLFSDAASQGPFLFYRLTIDSPHANEINNQASVPFHTRFYVNLSEGGVFSHVVQEPSIVSTLLENVFIALKNNETDEQAAAFFGDDTTEPYRFRFSSKHPMAQLLRNVKTGDSITYVIGRGDRRNFNAESLTVDRGTQTESITATGTSECYNTFHTCQDPGKANYTPSPLKLRFSFPVAGRAEDAADAFPCLQSVSTSPTKINATGIERAVSPFGKRARVKITLQDFDHGDGVFDKYNRTPAGGSFWSRWKARNKHYIGRRLIVYEGVAGQALDDMASRFYLVDKIDGPDQNGRVTITGKDVLKIAEDKNAVVPKPSRGRLENDITETQGSLSLVPAGVGREYSVTGLNVDDGYIRIGNEIMSFDLNGDDMTIGRGALNTEAKAHEAGEVVQLVKTYPLSPGRAMRAHEIIYDLLVNEAGIDSDYIDGNDWWAEGNVWLASHTYKTYLSKPEGVQALLGEIAQKGVTLWWDERERKIKLDTVRPERPEEIAAGYPHLSDDNALLEYPAFSEDDKTRLTRLFYYFDIVDYVKSRMEETNYRRLQIGLNLQAERPIEYGEEKHAGIFSRWLTRTHASVVGEILQRYLSRFEHPQIEVKAMVELSALGEAWTGDIVSMATTAFQNPDGSIPTKLWQIVSAEYKRDHAVLLLRETDYPTQTVRLVGNTNATGAGAGDTTVTGDDPIGGTGRFAFIMANNAPTYNNATTAQRDEESAAWVAGDDSLMSDDTGGYSII